jgi:ubiquitin C-terminal hydrolase
MDGSNFYKTKTVDAEQIFMRELQNFNPESCQADCSEYLAFVLDKLHEDLKDIYVPN